MYARERRAFALFFLSRLLINCKRFFGHEYVTVAIRKCAVITRRRHPPNPLPECHDIQRPQRSLRIGFATASIIVCLNSRETSYDSCLYKREVEIFEMSAVSCEVVATRSPTAITRNSGGLTHHSNRRSSYRGQNKNPSCQQGGASCPALQSMHSCPQLVIYAVDYGSHLQGTILLGIRDLSMFLCGRSYYLCEAHLGCLRRVQRF